MAHARALFHRAKLMEAWRAYAHLGKVEANDTLRIKI